MRKPAQRPPMIRPQTGPTSIQGGQPQRVLVAQGEARPGMVQGQHWIWRTWWEQCPLDRLPYTRPTPRSHADPRLSNKAL